MVRSLLSLTLFLSIELAIAEQVADTTISLSGVEANGKFIQVEADEDGPIEAVVQSGASGSQGVSVRPESGTWNFSRHGRIEAVVSNPGTVSLPLSLRVDNQGHWKNAPWNTEAVRLEPGDTRTLVVFFGFSYGEKPGFSLDPTAVTQLLFFTEGAEKERKFSILSVKAVGSRGETPALWDQSANQEPEDGFLFGPNSGWKTTRQLSGHQDAKGAKDGSALKLQFPNSAGSVKYRRPSGKWNLRSANHVEILVHNDGLKPARPGARIDSASGSTPVAILETPIPPGESATVRVPFASFDPWVPGDTTSTGKEDGDGGGFDSQAVQSVTIFPGETTEPVSLRIETIRATAPSATLPDWSGERPPAPGEWEITLNENFDAPELDQSRWNIYTANHWDKRSHFSRDNVLTSNGTTRLRFERKTGPHNDEADGKITDYATGFLDTFGKWTQRYGYFESRLRLPEAPGLWPAFWMMPDRGPADAPRWKREQTTNGGMEFDIMEHLTGWGPYRYNVAFHWDGYGKGHRRTGTSNIYYQHDEEGYITVGMLWLPGKVTYFCNGKPVGHWESDRVSDVPSILMFTHVSGGWDNRAINDDLLPSDFEIDYVRAWQRKDLR